MAFATCQCATGAQHIALFLIFDFWRACRTLARKLHTVFNLNLIEHKISLQSSTLLTLHLILTYFWYPVVYMGYFYVQFAFRHFFCVTLGLKLEKINISNIYFSNVEMRHPISKRSNWNAIQSRSVDAGLNHITVNLI